MKKIKSIYLVVVLVLVVVGIYFIFAKQFDYETPIFSEIVEGEIVEGAVNFIWNKPERGDEDYFFTIGCADNNDGEEKYHILASLTYGGKYETIVSEEILSTFKFMFVSKITCYNLSPIFIYFPLIL